MKFDPVFSPDALEDLLFFRKFDREKIRTAIRKSLTEEPEKKSQNRKPLRENAVANWELRVGAFRVLYDIDLEEMLVKIKTVAEKKGNKYFVRGKELEL